MRPKSGTRSPGWKNLKKGRGERRKRNKVRKKSVQENGWARRVKTVEEPVGVEVKGMRKIRS
eukprot:2376406-Karenia_brevis.AAC.1